jgi:hypothetical protein
MALIRANFELPQASVIRATERRVSAYGGGKASALTSQRIRFFTQPCSSQMPEQCRVARESLPPSMQAGCLHRLPD